MRYKHQIKLPNVYWGIYFYFMFTLLLAPQQAFAEETFADDPKPTMGQSFRKRNTQLSQQINSLATQLDQLLANRRYRNLPNNSSVTLTSLVDSREGAKPVSSGHVDINLRLPGVERDWKLLFSTYDREDETQGLQRNRPGAQYGENTLGAGVQFGREVGKIRTTFRPRIELKDPLISSFLIKFQNEIKLKIHKIRQQLKLFVHSEDGSGQSYTIDVDRELGSGFVFRFINEQQYLDNENSFSTSHGPELLYRLADDMGLSTSLIFNSNSRPNFGLRSYVHRWSFRHQLFHKVMAYQITPSLSFEKDRNFKGHAGIAVQVEATF